MNCINMFVHGIIKGFDIKVTKRLVLSIVFAGTFILGGCEAEDDLFRHFIIEAGEHYSTPRVVENLQSDKLVFQARFDASAVYNFKQEGFQDSKNKLLGFSDCNATHHENSARFVWQWFNDRLEIYAYCYVNGERVEQFIGTVNIDEVNRYEIRLEKDAYVFTLNDGDPVSIKRGNVCDKGVYYMLWPYFGGSLPAPHNVFIDIKIQH